MSPKRVTLQAMLSRYQPLAVYSLLLAGAAFLGLEPGARYSDYDSAGSGDTYYVDLEKVNTIGELQATVTCFVRRCSIEAVNDR
jgi:hypothetical protein